MDPSSRLDHALFQLTPTRTRCDLVIVGGGVSERLASGLLQPFLSHLKSAKDQISKGGYSIILRPASPHVPWFTKSTLQRFVSFVSTPEVLERFVTIEKEIEQIESSIHSSEKSSEAEGNVSSADGYVKRLATSSKLKDELTGTNHAGPAGCEENSRVHLQRVLDNRKAVLCKEQAMAYARSLVAGFYSDSADDLVSFADAFGASRLRDACINFLDLCKQKNEDKLWIDEIAAMQACSQPVLPYLRTSGIILAGEDNDPSSKLNGLVDASVSESTASHASLDIHQDNSLPTSAETPSTNGKAQIPMSWPNHLPKYIHNFQGPAFQQMPPYHGYLHASMQASSSYYTGNMQWPPNVEDSHILDRELDYHKLSLKKKKKHSQVLEHSEEDASTASTESSYESDSDEHSRHGKKHPSTDQLHKKKPGKKSSRKVVIRNINYITSNGDGERGSISEGSLSNEEEFINVKHQVEEAVVSHERRYKSTSCHNKKPDSAKHPGMLNSSLDADSNGRKGNDNWDAFQNLLLRDDESTFGTEKQPVKFQEEYIMDKNLEDGRPIAFNRKPEDVTNTQVVSNDFFVVGKRELDNEGQNCIEYFKEGKDEPPIIKKKYSRDELLFSQKNEESGNLSSAATLSRCGTESSLTKCQKEEDWFIINHEPGKPANEDGNKDFSMFNGVSISSSVTDCFNVEKNKKAIMADDSFMIQARSPENQFNSQSAADISLVSDMAGATEFTNSTQEVSHNKTETLNSHEPDDLFMVLERNSAVGQSVAPWNMEMDYQNNISLNEANRKLSVVETNVKQLSNCEGTDTKTPGVQTGKVSSKEAKSKALKTSLGKSKSDIISGSKASPRSRTTVVNSKHAKEEENKKRMEELLIQRQKRIAERSASKKTGTETKTSLNNVQTEKPKIHPSSDDTKKLHRPILRNSTIDRLATARANQKASTSQAKSGPTKKSTLTTNGVSSKKTAGTETKKQGPKEVKSSNKKEDTKKTNGALRFDTNAQPKNETEASIVLTMKSDDAQSVKPNNTNVDLKDIGELCRTSSSEKIASHLISEREYMLGNVGQVHMDSSMPSQDPTFGGNLSKGEEVLDKVSSLPGDNEPHVTDATIDPTAATPSKPLIVSAVNTKVNQEIDENNAISPKISGKEISTPPPSERVMSEPIHSRKKWNSDEDSSKPAKGFRKLLFFGRKS